jgi:predicted ATPase
VVVEDVHWSDPTTLTLIDRVVDQAAGQRLLVLLTCRPSVEPRWAGDHGHPLSLTRLPPGEAADLVRHAAGGSRLPEELAAAIAEKTDGIPLFTEELKKTVIESGGLQGTGGRYRLVRPLDQLSIPTTLHDSLLERLDRTAEAKEVAQWGAAIGREFSHSLLAAASSLDAETLERSLERLERSELIRRSGTAPEASYSFEPFLVRDAAYESLLRRRRREMHARIAAALEESVPFIADESPELLAHHLGEAGDTLRAASLWNAAGRQALAAANYDEGVARIERGLALLAPAERERSTLLVEVRLLESLGLALYSTRGYAHPSVEATFARAEAVCNELGDETPLQTLYGI